VTRLARARRRLHRRLAARGLGLAGGAFAAALGRAAESPPIRSALLAAAVRTGTVASLHEVASAGAASARVVALTRGVSKAMLMTRIKIVSAVLLALGLAGAGITARSYQLAAAEPLQLRGSSALSAVADQPDAANKPGRPEGARRQSGEQTEKVEEVVTQTFKTGKAPKLLVEMHNGAIELDASAEGEIQVRITKVARGQTAEAAREALKRLQIKMSHDGNKVTITATQDRDKARQTSVGASAELKVPAGAVLELKTGNGAVRVKGGTGALRVQTANGAIRITDHRSPQRLSTRNGAIVVTGATGKLELDTANGPVDIQADKAVVSAKTTNGGMKFSGTLGEGKHALQTKNGTILLTLPADFRFKLDAKTSNGTVRSGFPIERTGSKSRTLLAGTVGADPAATITLQTSNGGIDIRQKK